MNLTIVQVLGVDISPVMELGDMPDNLNQEVRQQTYPDCSKNSSVMLVMLVML